MTDTLNATELRRWAEHCLAQANDGMAAQDFEKMPHRLEQQIVLVGKIMMDDAWRNARLFGNPRDGGLAQPILMNRRNGGIDKLPTPYRPHAKLGHGFFFLAILEEFLYIVFGWLFN